MPRPPKLTDIQRARLSTLDKQLCRAICSRNFEIAKSIVADIQTLLRPTGHITRIIQYKNALFELALDNGMYDYAERGFTGNMRLTAPGTRVHLEATALLAVCLLRRNRHEEAKKHIREVLTNESVIRSPRTRAIFHREIIDRFDEETALFSLRLLEQDKPDIDHIQDEAGKLLASYNEDELFAMLGRSLPESTKSILFDMNDFAQKQLPAAERKLLAPPAAAVTDGQAGKTVFKSLKRVLYNSLCDSNSDVYKAWCTNGLGLILNKKFLASAIIASLGKLGIGYNALLVYALALILRFGLDVYCEHNKPSGIMEIRNK